MEIKFQLIDCDYVLVDNSPIIRMFGKTKEGKTVCAFYKGLLPYFYVLPKKGKVEEVISFLHDHFKQLLVKIEEVEKFLPIGFQESKIKILKIVLKNPQQVVTVREGLRNSKIIQEIYEADILFRYRFMADFNVSGMLWVKVSGDKVNTQSVRTDMTITAKTVEPFEEISNVALKYMGLDIEVISERAAVPDSRKHQIAMMSLSFFPAYNGHNTLVLVSKPVKRPDDVICFQNEKDMLKKFVNIINSFDPDIVCGFNCNNFDIPFIEGRLRINKISRAIGRCNHKQLSCRKFGAWFRNSISGRTIVDVYSLIKEAVGKGLLRLKRYGLGDVSRKLLNEDKINITHSEIEKHWNGNEAQIKKLIDYARKDAELVLKLLLEKDMLGKFIEISKVSGLLLQDVLDSGEATRIENLLLREFDKKDFIIPCRPTSKEIQKRIDERTAKGLKGALVLDPDVGIHTNCTVYLDFKSMYPSIFIAWNICPTTLLIKNQTLEGLKILHGVKFVSPKIREGVVQKIVSRLMVERSKIKSQIEKASTEAERRILDSKQYALKIMTNAFYGYTGYVRARFYVLDIANAITSCGRNLIQKTKKIVESDKRFKVVYGDTDSVMVKLETTDIDKALELGKEIEKKINNELKDIVQIKIENVFKTLIVLTKKRYAGLSFKKMNGVWKEKMMMKGIETVRRDWCDLVSKTLYDVLEIILKEQKPRKAFTYVKEVLKRIEKNQIPIEELVITKSISKPIKQYKGIQPHIELVKKLKKRSPASAPGIGDRVGFVIVQGLRLISERAEDPNYVKQHGLKIDSRYYIESQVLPPLERVFEVIGVSKSELIGTGRQLLLTDAIRTKKQNVLRSIQGFVCNKCEKTFRRVPLIGKCSDCGGELLFYHDTEKSRQFRV